MRSSWPERLAGTYLVPCPWLVMPRWAAVEQMARVGPRDGYTPCPDPGDVFARDERTRPGGGARSGFAVFLAGGAGVAGRVARTGRSGPLGAVQVQGGACPERGGARCGGGGGLLGAVEAVAVDVEVAAGGGGDGDGGV